MAKAHNIGNSHRTADVIIQDDVRFSDMYLKEDVCNGLESAGFIKPSPIQLKAIPIGRFGIDLIVQAKSGTGKTCVFTVIALEMLDILNPNLQVLILAPTREIAYQIQQVVQTIGQGINCLNVAVFMGGKPINEDIAASKHCQIAVGSPGRVKHLIKEYNMDVSTVRLLVLDEADRLMGESFVDDIRYIHSKLPEHKQVIGASATYPEELENFLTSQLQVNAKRIQPEDDACLLLGLKQFVTVIPYHTTPLVQIKLKTKSLLNLLKSISFKQCLVFCNYQSRLPGMCRELIKEGWPAVQIYGSMPQTDRLNVLKQLQDFQCRVVLTTDLTSRGIDAENVDLVINLDLPYDVPTYLHRVGRAGRYGAQGIIVTVVHDGQELLNFRKIIKNIGGDGFTIPVLPEKIPNDLWTAQDEKFLQVEGIVGEFRCYESSEEKSVKPICEPFKDLIMFIGEDDKYETEMKTYDELLESFKKFDLNDSSEVGELTRKKKIPNLVGLCKDVITLTDDIHKTKDAQMCNEEEDDADDEESESELQLRSDSSSVNYNVDFSAWKYQLDLRRRFIQSQLYQFEMLSKG